MIDSLYISFCCKFKQYVSNWCFCSSCDKDCQSLSWSSRSEAVATGSTVIAYIFIEVLSTIAEEESKKIKQRQSEGIAIAKANGVYKGRKAVTKMTY